MSNLSRLLNNFKEKFPENLKDRVDFIENFVSNYIKKNNFNVKFLNFCNPGFHGVRTKNVIIICAPTQISTLGDFLYVIFHELRHEQQVSHIKMLNPLTDFDLNDFEALYEQYWEMELDADQFAKNMIAKIVIKLKIPIDFAQTQFTLSNYIKNYPTMGKMVQTYLRQIIDDIKKIKKSGMKYEDISDHPMIKKHLDNLENFI